MNRLSILVSNPLGPNLTRGKLLPLVALPDVCKVVVVQDVVGPALPKVHYVALGSPPLAGTLPRLGRALHVARRAIAMSIQLVRIRPSVVMGIYTMPHGLIAYLLGRLMGARVCIQVIGGPREIIDGGYWLDQWQVRRPSKRVEALYLHVLRRTDIVVVVGTETKRYLANEGVAPDRIHVISSKIDSRRFSPSLEDHHYDLILTAQLIKRKRVDLFLHIVAALTPLHSRIRVAVVGDGPSRADLQRLAASLELDDRVDFLGFHEDTEHYYRRAKIFVLTSSAEGLSLAMLEAMACGLPVVAPAVGDLADVVRNGDNGYLIDEDDQTAFVGAIHHLLDNDATRRRLGDNARSTILRGYTVEDGTRAWHAALQRLALSRQAQRWHPATASPTRDASEGDR